jgi:hypothetical protein
MMIIEPIVAEIAFFIGISGFSFANWTFRPVVRSLSGPLGVGYKDQSRRQKISWTGDED